jgi:hypothetical protein
MLIRNSNGKLEIVNKYQFKSDTQYYNRIMTIMKRSPHKTNINNNIESPVDKLLSKL